MYPDDLKYTKDHEWVRVQGDRARVGITHFAQKQLGDVVFLELPEVGRAVKAHEVFGTVESVKAVSELFTPVSGEVTAVNQALTEKVESLGQDPWNAGWMIKLKVASDAEWKALLDAGGYEKLCASES